MLDSFTTPAAASSGAASIPVDLVTQTAFKTWASAQDDALRNWAQVSSFRGQAGRALLVPGDAGGLSRVVYGLGQGEDPMVVCGLPSQLCAGTYHFSDAALSAAPWLSPDHLALSWALGTYAFTRYRKAPKTEQSVHLRLPSGSDGTRITNLAEAVFLVRDLVNTTAEQMGPAEVGQAARDLAKRHNARITSVEGDALLEQNFPLVHAVGRASSRPPRLVELAWGDPSAPKLTLVGKGVIFDTGGLNIKPGDSMELMKKDMGGAAHALGLGHMVMAAQLPVSLRIILPIVENAIAGNAFRPGDVLPSRKGLSVEIGNTDAEGRLILADALAYADEGEPDLLIDMATLTGAARIAMGPDIAPFYTHDRTLAADLMTAGETETDPVWHLPLYKPYAPWLDSVIADINHISHSRFAGSMTAALFLERFVEYAKSWLHFDVYAWNWQMRPGRAPGGEAQGIRALFAVLEDRYGSRQWVDRPQTTKPEKPAPSATLG